MKKRDLERKFEENGWWLKRHGSGHDIWTNGKAKESMPRHREIDERLANAIIKRQGL